MNTENRDVITLGADVGGKDAHIATHEHVLALRNFLRQECMGPYSDTIQEFALVLRIDGSVQSWGKVGIDNIAFKKRKSYITADIFMPQEVWITQDVVSLRDFLGTEVKKAMLMIGEYAKKQKVSISLDVLSCDLDRAIEKFCHIQ